MKQTAIVFKILLLFFFTNLSYAFEIRYCANSPIINIDPPKINDSTSHFFKNKIYETLFDFGTNYELKYVLAEKVTVSKDGLKISITLRKNILFHNNSFFKRARPLDADDVIFSFKRQMSKFLEKKDLKLFNAWTSLELDKAIVDIKKINDLQLEFILNKPIQSFFINLSDIITSIIPKDYALKHPDFLDTHPIGTGPFQIAKIKDKSSFTIEKNPQYRTPSKIDKIQFNFYSEEDLQNLKHLVTSCDMVDNPNIYSLQKASQSGHFFKESGTENSLSYLAFNSQKKPLSNPLIRKAIALSLNLKKYLSENYLDYGKIAVSPILPSMPEYNPGILPLTQDNNAAKEILRTQGLPNGFKLGIWVSDSRRIYLNEPAKLAKNIKSDLGKIGIEAKVFELPFEEFLRRVGNGEHDLVITGWANTFRPEEILNLFSCKSIENGNNESRWCNKEYDQFLNSLAIENNLEKRKQIISMIIPFLKKEIPFVPLFYTGKNILVRSTLPDDILDYTEFKDLKY